jgi:holo-[acyl-carrier protein] synthase
LVLLTGVDLVPVSSIRDSLDRFGDRFLCRIYTAGELEYCRSRTEEAELESLAARFAAKEATIKALRASELGIDWRTIEVVRDERGACGLRLSGAAAGAARAAGIHELSLSMSHAGGYAVAFVVGAIA